MLFNTIHFLWFFALVWLVYWTLGRVQWQNRFLLLASYFFYGYWDWRFLGLIAFSTVVDWGCGLALESGDATRRRRVLLLSVCTNLGLLGVFKYFNFFVESATELLGALGVRGADWSLDFILPIGISFYTFQTLSYSIDRYRGRVQPVRELSRFALYVSFFPQLVAGPIVRAREFAPALSVPRTFRWDDQAIGIQLVLWGLFKKAVVADNVGYFVNLAFGRETPVGLAMRIVAVVLFTIQIYADFSGYTDIARGTARLMGFEFPLNFIRPYFARNPAAFWRRWHVTLSTWLRDYLYISLGGNRHGAVRTYRNLLLTMLLGGLWHGAAWNFVIWGAYQGLLLVVHRAVAMRLPAPRDESRLRRVWTWFAFFPLVMYGWLLFRAQSWSQIVEWTRVTYGGLMGGLDLLSGDVVTMMVIGLAGALVVLIWDLVQERRGTRDTPLEGLSPAAQVAVCFILYAGCSLFGRYVSDEFIYFQF